ncbi:diguanylate cyclase [Proteobacteria bacterium 005FR1]|nr:diguanylate cyclase [Proteobacteria bacterium 005FR1]
MIYGFVFEVIVLAVALAERINREREAKEQAQALALAQQQSILELKDRTNNELEEQVQKRTEELRSAMAALGEANQELAAMTRTDPLTGLSNRRHFDEMLDAETARAARAGFRHDDRLISTTASIGLMSGKPGRLPAAEELVAAADRALYLAKQKGRNRTEVAREMAVLENAAV